MNMQKVDFMSKTLNTLVFGANISNKIETVIFTWEMFRFDIYKNSVGF